MSGVLLLPQQLRRKHTYQPGRAGSHAPKMQEEVGPAGTPAPFPLPA